MGGIGIGGATKEGRKTANDFAHFNREGGREGRQTEDAFQLAEEGNVEEDEEDGDGVPSRATAKNALVCDDFGAVLWANEKVRLDDAVTECESDGLCGMGCVNAILY